MSNEFEGLTIKGTVEIMESKYGYCELCGEVLSVNFESHPYGDTNYDEAMIYCEKCD